MALFGESLALPTDLAIGAGFSDARPDPGQENDNPFVVDQSDSNPIGTDQIEIPTDYWHGETTPVPPQIAGRMGVDARGDFRASVPNTLATQYANGRTASRGRTPSIVFAPSPQADLGDTIGAATGAPPSEGKAPTVFGQPSAMLTDPKFLQLARQDPHAAKKFYEENNPGHSLQNDIKLQQAIEVEKAKYMRDEAAKMIDKGLKFDPITGEPTLTKMIKNPNMAQAMTQPFIESPNEKLTDSEKAILYGMNGHPGGYELRMGQKPPQGVPTPDGLTPAEATQFRQQVSQSIQTDKRTGVSDKQKLTDAYMKVWNTNRSTQESAKATAANTTVAKANPGNLIDRAANTGARYANLVSSSIARPRQLLGSILGPLGVPGAGELENTPATQFSGQQVKSLFGFE